MLVVTGTFATLVELDLNVGELFTSGYGRLVLAKVALLALTMPLARINQQRHLPAIRQGGPSQLEPLRRFVRRELVLAALIVAATAALVHSSPQDHSTMNHQTSHDSH